VRTEEAVSPSLPVPARALPIRTTLSDIMWHDCLLPALLMSSELAWAGDWLVSSRAQVKRGTGALFVGAMAMVMEPRGVDASCTRMSEAPGSAGQAWRDGAWALMSGPI